MLSLGGLGGGLVLWMLAMVGTIVAQRRLLGPGNALVAAYLVNSWLIYWPGALVYTLPWYLGANGDVTRAGFAQSVAGVLAFGGGALLITLLLRATRGAPRLPSLPAVEPGLARAYILAGVISAVAVFPLAGLVPSLSAITSMINLLVVAGMAVRCWQARAENDWRTFWGVLAAGMLLPLFTIGLWGFASFGASAFAVLLIFAFGLVRFRLRALVVGLLIGYLALSAYVTYYRDRGRIREVVWSEAGVERRSDIILDSVLAVEGFDLQNRDHLYSIDERLNQNLLVGSAITYIDLGYAQFAGGTTVWNAALALVPRIIWPEKPLVAGGNRLVSSYTGIAFDRSTSVGIGQIMEFYINFGATGVVVGMALLGALLAGLDWLAARALQRGDARRFAFWLLAGLGLLQVNGAIFEMSASLLAGLVAVVLVHRLLPLFGVRRPVQVPSTPLPGRSLP